MDTKILIEEINRINELTVSKAIFTENTDVNIDREIFSSCKGSVYNITKNVESF